ncbi:MAG: hypothetical protein IJD43_05065 [Thermoguttaceae bacterium]|nr:hypothetical protein [Thermoguttaceae bacterium]
MKRIYFRDCADRWLDALVADECDEEEIFLRETEFTREEDWDIEDTLEDYRQFEDPAYIPSWEKE